MGGEGGIKREGALCADRRGGALMHGGRGHQADPAVAMLAVVPVEEPLAVRAGVLDRAEPLREVGPVLQGLELRLGVRIVIRDMRATVGLGDVQIDQQCRDGFGAHAGAAIGVQRQGPGCDVFLLQCLGNEELGERGGFALGNHPSDDVAAEDIEDDVQVEAGPFGRALQLGDVPTPNLAGPDRQQFGLGVDGVHALTAPLPALMAGRQKPVHRADRAVIPAFVEQGGVDRRRSHIGEALAVEHFQQ